MASDYPPPTEDNGLKIRILESNLQIAQRQIEDIARLLNPYNAEVIYAFDSAGDPNGYETLCRRAGGWAGIDVSSLPGALQPGSDVSNASNPMHTITWGTYAGGVPTIGGTPLETDVDLNIITLSPTDEVVYVQFDFTYDTTSGAITIVDQEIKSTTMASFEALISSASSGTGVFYQILFGVSITAPVGSGPYTVLAAPGVGGSQNLGICLTQPINTGLDDGITGPWGV